MKGYMELALGAILLVLMYEKPYALTEMANSLLGKAVMIIGVGIIAKNNGLASGLLAALIMIILIHENVEGMTTTTSLQKDKKKKKNYEEKGYIKLNSSDVNKALKKAGIKNLKNAGECGPCRTQKNGTTCDVFIKPHHNKTTTEEKNESLTDIRMTEGFRNREAYENTIASMKFSNGQTGAGQNKYNQF
jgi:hypothetical protein